jgi:hypothetical protein
MPGHAHPLRISARMLRSPDSLHRTIDSGSNSQRCKTQSHTRRQTYTHRDRAVVRERKRKRERERQREREREREREGERGGLRENNEPGRMAKGHYSVSIASDLLLSGRPSPSFVH